MDIELVTDPYACMIVSPLADLGGGILWRPPVYSLFPSEFSVVIKAPDLRSPYRGFDSRLPYCRGATLGKLFRHSRAKRLSQVTTAWRYRMAQFDYFKNFNCICLNAQNHVIIVSKSTS